MNGFHQIWNSYTLILQIYFLHKRKSVQYTIKYYPQYYAY
nr:MAG TPA: hypothetical protein [Caudoviricetes sp.]